MIRWCLSNSFDLGTIDFTKQRATGRIYNVSESTIIVADLVRAIASIVGWQGKIVILPKSQMPDTWKFEANLESKLIGMTINLITLKGTNPINFAIANFFN
ncbi:MAG: hypothetical protein HC939_05145 [Pleurocapsa sp. SU_5_0]|nr:hypothetical protein [Pleurocapsa sp. SU_5_0]